MGVAARSAGAEEKGWGACSGRTRQGKAGKAKEVMWDDGKGRKSLETNLSITKKKKRHLIAIPTAADGQ